jgi:hypothetical protein
MPMATPSTRKLAGLAKVNIESIKEFGYFTIAKLGAPGKR